MKNKAKLAFDLLEQGMEVLSLSENSSTMGGTDPSDGDTWVVDGQTFVWSSVANAWVGNELNNVVITTTSTSSSGGYWSWSYYSSGTGSYWTNMLSSGGYVGGGGGGGSTGGGGEGSSSSSNYEIASNIASNAIATGLAFNEFYTSMSSAIFSNTPITANDFVKNIFDNNPSGSFMDDIRAAGEFKGIAILSATGKVLGVTQAVGSLYVLGEDILDGGGVSAVNVADAAISVGSFYIKSNVVGLAVSMGWLLIKGQLEE